jgi:hypothetical protein
VLKPSVIGWRSDRGWRDRENLRHGEPIFSDAAERFQGGMLPFPSLYGLKASLEWMLEMGPAAIEKRVLELAKACGGDGRSPIVALAVEKTRERLRRDFANGAFWFRRGAGNYVFPHFCNDESDVELLRGQTDALG